MKRKLVLTKELLSELTADELRGVVGAEATLLAACETKITVLQPGCASDPRVCHYQTFPC